MARGSLGAVTYMIPRLQEALDTLFALAERKGWDLDFHVDESADPAARSLGRRSPTRALARNVSGHASSSAIAARWPGRTTSERERVVDKVARAGIAVVSLPMCNMFLQDRHAGAHAALARRHRAARTEGGRASRR